MSTRFQRCLCALTLVAACSDEAQAPGTPSRPTPPKLDADAVPGSAEAFLEALLPVAGGGVRVVYDVTGPAEMAGILEIEVAPGALRRDAWTVRMASAEGGVQVEGLTIARPEQVWTGAKGSAGAVVDAPLRRLAERFAAQKLDRRSRIMRGVRAWRADLAIARQENPGDTESVAGQDCVKLQIAAQEICLWEELGIPLRYRGERFTIEANKIEPTSIAASQFDLPQEAKNARRSSSSLPSDEELDAILSGLAAGNYAPLALLVKPRMPSLETGN